MRPWFTPFILLCIVGFSARLGYQMARAPVLPRFADELGAQSWLIGLIIGASTITGIFFKFPAGALSDVVGRRRMLLIGSAFFAFPPFLYLLVNEPYSLLAIRFVHGMATAIFSPVAAAAVADLFQKGRGEKLGWFASSNEFGSAFGPLIGGVVLASLVGASLTEFRILYLIVGGLGILTFLVVLGLPIGKSEVSIKREGSSSRFKQLKAGMSEILSNQSILVASSAESAMFLAVGALAGFLPLYARNIVGLGDAYVGLLIWVPLVMAMAGKPFAGRLSDRVGRKSIIMIGLALCASTLPLIPMTTSLAGLVVEGAIFGIGMSIVTPATTALVTDLCKEGNHGAALGVFGTIWDVGEASGPILAGILIGAFGSVDSASAYRAAFLIIVCVLVVVGCVFYLMVKEPKLPEPEA